MSCSEVKWCRITSKGRKVVGERTDFRRVPELVPQARTNSKLVDRETQILALVMFCYSIITRLLLDGNLSACHISHVCLSPRHQNEHAFIKMTSGSFAMPSWKHVG